MVFDDKLLSFHIIETYKNENWMTWTYPTIADELKTFILKHCYCDVKTNNFYCIRYRNLWIYLRNSINFTIVLVTELFDVVKYRKISNIFAKTYAKNTNPVDVLRCYLKLFVTGICEYDKESFFDAKNYRKKTDLKGLIKTFRNDIVLIFNAIMLKRRILLYHNDVEQTQKAMLLLVDLVPNRDCNDYVHPIVKSNELKNLSFYLSGTTDTSLRQRENLYDIFIDLHTFEVIVSSEASKLMRLPSQLKHFGEFLIKSVENEEQIIKLINTKIKELLNDLEKFMTITTDNGKKMLTVKDLKSKNLDEVEENFYFNLAVAENAIML